jgi:hypothetical protein
LFVGADEGLPVGYLQNLDFFHGPSEIILSNSCFSAHVGQGETLVLVFPNEIDDSLGPPGEIGLLSEIRKWLLRASHFLLDEAQLIAESNEELSIPLPLVEGQHEDAAEIVFCFFDLNDRSLTLEKYPAM